ncbi:MAG: hypothetical protein Q7J31_13230 [Syntrophales bacterium]|nr:hypothetical protein [Syntrophales bacterium]
MKISKNFLVPRGIIAIIACSYIFLALQPDLRLSVPTLLGASAVCIISLAFLLYEEGKGKLALSPSTILFFALFFRLLFLFRLPELSDDIYRYLWDGLQVLHGNNPYAAAPFDVRPFDNLSASLLAKINHPRLVTIYPPFAQIVFAAGAAISHSFIGFKVLMVILDLGICSLLCKILPRMNLSAGRAILYAWHPLPVIEIAGSGHVDGVVILLFFLTIYVLLPKPARDVSAQDLHRLPSFMAPQYAKPLLAGTVFALAVLVKFIPLIYLPALLMATVNPLTFGLVFLTASLFIALPFTPDLTHMLSTLSIYLQNWEFSNFAFRLLRNLLSSGNQARIILSGLFISCLTAFTVSFRMKSRDRDTQQKFLLFMKSLYGITFGFLLLTPTLHPWYALYLVSFLPFMAGSAGLVLTWAVFLSYRVLIGYAIHGQWIESDLIAAVIWFSPVVAWSARSAIQLFFRQKVSWTSS